MTEIKRLQEGVTLGIISKVKFDQVLAWHDKAVQDKAQTRAAQLRNGYQNKSKYEPEPMKPRRSQEIRVLELSIEFTKHELKSCLAEYASEEKTKRIAILKRTLCEQETSRMQLYLLSPVVVQPPHLPAPRAIDPVELPLAPQKAPILTKQEIAIHEKAHHAIQLMMQVQALVSDLQFTPVFHKQNPSSRLNAKDAELCLNWNNMVLPQMDSNEELIWNRLKVMDRYRQCLLLSARSAEHVMESYYMQLGFTVEDVSLQQIDRASDDWKFFDLRVGDRCIDVKNARESFNGQGHFVEHCVPRFKENRVTGEHISIAGVVSPYIADPSDYRHHSKFAIVLGEVNRPEVSNLCQWAHDRFGPQLDLAGIWKDNFLPGWLFEYPPEHYPNRIKAVDSIADLAWRLIENDAFGNRLPGWMLVLCKDDALIRSLPLDERKRKLVADLRSMSASAGLTRRTLYVYAMGLTLENLVKGLSPIEDLNTLLEILELPCDGKSTTTMLGLQDPLGYVKFIIETMSAIAKRLLDSQTVITGFKLSHPAILKGVCADGSVLTLLAYCGGWQEFPVRAKCGTTPLVILKNKHCPECGRLICHNCSHCSDLCSLCEPRQLNLASTHAE